jgi:predicted bacteriocin transport accessory protein
MLVLVGILLSACGPAFSDGVYDKKEMFKEDVEKEFILYYYATSCVHCSNFKPTVNEYAQLDNALPIYAIDGDDEVTHDIYKYFIEEKGWTLEGTPTMYHIKDGEVVEVYQGVQELKDLPLKGE